MTAPTISELRKLREQCGSIDAVAKRLGITRSVAREWFKNVPSDEPMPEPEDHEVEIISWDFSDMGSLRIYALGDVHKGAGSHQRERWRDWLNYLADEDDAVMIGTGDFHNAGIVGSKSDVYEELMTVEEAGDELHEELEPIKDKILVLVPGNHDWRVFRAVGLCPVNALAKRLDAPYARAAVLLDIRVGDIDYQVYLRHGTGNGQSDAAMEKGAKVFPLADVQIQGHTHKPKITVDDYFVVEDGEIRRRSRHNTVIGSFLGYERYAAERGYAPTRIGAPRIRLDGRVRDVKVSV